MCVHMYTYMEQRIYPPPLRGNHLSDTNYFSNTSFLQILTVFERGASSRPMSVLIFCISEGLTQAES